jgi:hypothetical protein
MLTGMSESHDETVSPANTVPACESSQISEKPKITLSHNQQLLEGYQQAFDHFNNALFGGKLPECILSFNAVGNSTGYFKPAIWKFGSDRPVPEIAINPKLLGYADDFLLQVLVRCMVFLWQYTYGNPSSRMGYCSDEFTDKMAAIGLPCREKSGMSVKWNVNPNGKYSQCRPINHRLFFAMENFAPDPPKSTRVKFTCSKCGSKAMGSAGLKVTCHTLDCDTPMTAQTSE